MVERTIAWLNRLPPRLAKDWENLNRNALAFIKLGGVHSTHAPNKLCNPIIKSPDGL